MWYNSKRIKINIISKEKKYLKILPGWPEVTIGGCIANNVHGKNPYRDGVFQGDSGRNRDNSSWEELFNNC